jgi:hypothetical protein
MNKNNNTNYIDNTHKDIQTKIISMYSINTWLKLYSCIILDIKIINNYEYMIFYKEIPNVIKKKIVYSTNNIICE